MDKNYCRTKDLVTLIKNWKQVPRKRTRHPKKCVILGAGAFGTAMANILARKGHLVQLCFRDEEKEEAAKAKTHRKNFMAFPDLFLEQGIEPILFSQLKDILPQSELIIHCVPVQFSKAYLEKIKTWIPKTVPVVSTSKGIDAHSLEFMQDIFSSVLGEDQPALYLSGPSFAIGLMHGDPTIVTLAGKDMEVAHMVQMWISTPDLRVLTTNDIVGLEVSGALKNVLAIASGLAEGLGMGPNTQASLITRGWRDISSLVDALGGSETTLLGLSGLGDMMMTCYGGYSRNAKFGFLLAQGHSIEDAQAKIGQVVEGFPTCGAALQLAKRLNINVPVLQSINFVIQGRISATDMVTHIMSMPLQDEF